MEDWYLHRVHTLNKDYLKDCNNLYVKKMGDYSLAQNTALQGLSLAKPAGCYAWFLAHKLKQRQKKNGGATAAAPIQSSQVLTKKDRQRR